MKNRLFILLAMFAGSLIACQNAPKKGPAPSAQAEPPKTEQAKLQPRGSMPSDARCFRAKDKDGQRTWELRMVMLDKTNLAADLQVTSSQSSDFAQGKINRFVKDGDGFFGSWNFRMQSDNMGHIRQVSFLKKGKGLVERSQNPDDDGRLYEPCSCAELK